MVSRSIRSRLIDVAASDTHRCKYWNTRVAALIAALALAASGFALTAVEAVTRGIDDLDDSRPTLRVSLLEEQTGDRPFTEIVVFGEYWEAPMVSLIACIPPVIVQVNAYDVERQCVTGGADSEFTVGRATVEPVLGVFSQEITVGAASQDIVVFAFGNGTNEVAATGVGPLLDVPTAEPTLSAEQQRIKELEATLVSQSDLIVAQENLLNAYRCLFNVDTQVVPGGC